MYFLYCIVRTPAFFSFPSPPFLFPFPFPFHVFPLFHFPPFNLFFSPFPSNFFPSSLSPLLFLLPLSLPFSPFLFPLLLPSFSFSFPISYPFISLFSLPFLCPHICFRYLLLRSLRAPRYRSCVGCCCSGSSTC